MQLRHKEGHPVHVTDVDCCPSAMRMAPSSEWRRASDEQKFASDRDRNRHTLAAHGCVDETTGVPNQEFTQFHLAENLASFVALSPSIRRPCHHR